MMRRKLAPLMMGITFVASMAFVGSGVAQDATPERSPAGPECVPNELDGTCLTLSPAGDRVDLAPPVFSDPSTITNPLFPVSDLHSVLQMGTVEGLPFRVEVTLLPETRVIEWDGQRIETLVSQYQAYSNGQILEVAVDLYAQADDGSVWYFGEAVSNYEDGLLVDTHGTWIAGRDGPPGMIMPANPQPGDVYRPENIPGNVFEEVTVQSVDNRVDGPIGAIDGAIVVRGLHQDGGTEDKTFTPGYSEFLTGGGGDIEAVALAIPHDALGGPVPAPLDTLTTAAIGLLDETAADDSVAAADTLATMNAAWTTYRADPVPAMLDTQMSDAMGALDTAVAATDPVATRQAAIDVAQAGLDLQLRYLAPVDIDAVRFTLWTHQLETHVMADDPAAVGGDATTLEWIWDRIAHTVSPDTADQIDALLDQLQPAAVGDVTTASDLAAELRDAIAGG